MMSHKQVCFNLGFVKVRKLDAHNIGKTKEKRVTHQTLLISRFFSLLPYEIMIYVLCFILEQY
jgi:hypothetical protein